MLLSETCPAADIAPLAGALKQMPIQSLPARSASSQGSPSQMAAHSAVQPLPAKAQTEHGQGSKPGPKLDDVLAKTKASFALLKPPEQLVFCSAVAKHIETQAQAALMGQPSWYTPSHAKRRLEQVAYNKPILKFMVERDRARARLSASSEPAAEIWQTIGLVQGLSSELPVLARWDECTALVEAGLTLVPRSVADKALAAKRSQKLGA